MLKSPSLSAALEEKNDNLDLKNKLSQVTQSRIKSNKQYLYVHCMLIIYL